jgi:hypothetical protein
MASTILGMKSAPLAMFARNLDARVNPARGLLNGAMVAMLCGASLFAPAAADADAGCIQWGFPGRRGDRGDQAAGRSGSRQRRIKRYRLTRAEIAPSQ